MRALHTVSQKVVALLLFIGGTTAMVNARELSPQAQELLILFAHKLNVSPKDQAAMKLTFAPVSDGILTKDIATTAEVQASENNVYDINPLISGTVMTASPQQGDLVKSGDVLATIRSADVADEIQKLISKRAELLSNIEHTKSSYQEQIALQTKQMNLDKLDYEREQSLYNEGIAAQKDYQNAKNAFETSQVKLKALDDQGGQDLTLLRKNLMMTMRNMSAQLRMAGISEAAIKKAVDAGKVIADIPIKSPVSGIVSFRDINQGENISANKKIFSIVKLSPIWVLVDVPEEQLQFVHIGQTVRIRTPNRTYLHGTISAINPIVDQPGHSSHVRIVTPNTDAELKPGMSVAAEIIIGRSGELKTLVPKNAIYDIDDRHYAYVAYPNYFAPVEVKLGERSEDKVEVTDGLFPGEKVVVGGVKELQTMSVYRARQEELEESGNRNETTFFRTQIKNHNQRMANKMSDKDVYLLEGAFGGMVGTLLLGGLFLSLNRKMR